MNLINVDGAIECIEDQIEDLTEVLKIYHTILRNLKTLNENGRINDSFNNAGFDDEQIETIFKIISE